MVFSSVIFLFYFLPTVLLFYYLARTNHLRNLLLLFSSLLFYAWGEPLFVPVLVGSIGINYWIALRLQSPGRTAWTYLAAGITWNLALLAIFKYLDFAIEIVAPALQSTLGVSVEGPDLPLPIGISFFSFQAISYLIDVHRGDAEAEDSPLNVALYIAMFPQLIAGPIVRFKTVSKQIHSRRHSLLRASVGLQIFVTGLAQKVLLANEVALVADRAFETSALGIGAIGAWLGLGAYTLQIYFDFAGYSAMAIGLGLVFGFTFPRNFRTPYASRSITEFWRRWHISLSSWFRDYLYIPLGGSRNGKLKTMRNLFLVFLLCGLWHGAAINFLVWGLHHGFFLSLERTRFGRFLEALPVPLQRLYSLLIVMTGWVWFRANDWNAALGYYAALAGHRGLWSGYSLLEPWVTPIFVVTACIAIVYSFDAKPVRRTLRRLGGRVIAGRRPRSAIQSVALGIYNIQYPTLALLCASSVIVGGYNPFLYFRF